MRASARFLVPTLCAFLAACGSDDGPSQQPDIDGSVTVIDAGPDAAPIDESPLLIKNFNARLLQGNFQCTPVGGSLVDCAVYQLSFVIENRSTTASILRIDSIEWSIGAASGRVNRECSSSPWSVRPPMSSEVIDIDVDYDSGTNFTFPCDGVDFNNTVMNLAAAPYAGEMTLKLEFTMKDAEFVQIETSTTLIDAT